MPAQNAEGGDSRVDSTSGSRAEVISAGVPSWLDELQLIPGPPWHAMSTRSLDGSAWLMADAQRDTQLAEKRRLLGAIPDAVSATLPGTIVQAAAAEAGELVSAASGQQPLESDRAPLEAAALRVQEDLCVLLRNGDHWRLVAGVVCFPSMWRLTDKLGLSMTEVHGPVPGYADELAARVDRFLNRMQPDRPVWRRNWFIHHAGDLHHPAPPPPPPCPPAVPDGLWLRSERQTLRRLPRTGAVLFTIGTQQVPLAVVGHRPDIAAGMAASICSWSAELIEYRNASNWIDPVAAWLLAVGHTETTVARRPP